MEKTVVNAALVAAGFNGFQWNKDSVSAHSYFGTLHNFSPNACQRLETAQIAITRLLHGARFQSAWNPSTAVYNLLIHFPEKPCTARRGRKYGL